jgi:hypothetical protein
MQHNSSLHLTGINTAITLQSNATWKMILLWAASQVKNCSGKQQQQASHDNHARMVSIVTIVSITIFAGLTRC